MEENEKLTPPAGVVAKMYTSHLGVILSNLSILCCVLAVLSIVSIFLPVLYFIGLIIMTVFTLGVVFVLIPNFASWWKFGGTFFTSVTEFMHNAFPIFGITAIVTALASIILLLLDRNNRNWSRIILSIGALVFIIAVLSGTI